jgi:hypothetical protein
MNRLTPPTFRAKCKTKSAISGSTAGAINNVKIDVAQSQRPKLLCDRPNSGGSYMLDPDDEAYVDRALTGAMHGSIPAKTPIWALTPSGFDRSQVPPGSPGDRVVAHRCRRTPDGWRARLGPDGRPPAQYSNRGEHVPRRARLTALLDHRCSQRRQTQM